MESGGVFVFVAGGGLDEAGGEELLLGAWLAAKDLLVGGAHEFGVVDGLFK